MQSGGVPRLHTAAEFFTPLHGFDSSLGRRKLSSASAMRGYSEFALSAAAGLIEYMNQVDNASYTSIYMRGKAYITNADGTPGEMRSPPPTKTSLTPPLPFPAISLILLPTCCIVASLCCRLRSDWLSGLSNCVCMWCSMQVYFSTLDPNASAVILQANGGTKMLINSSEAGGFFVFNPAGGLTNCSRDVPEDLYPSDALAVVSARATDDSLTLIVDECARSLLCDSRLNSAAVSGRS